MKAPRILILSVIVVLILSRRIKEQFFSKKFLKKVKNVKKVKSKNYFKACSYKVQNLSIKNEFKCKNILFKAVYSTVILRTRFTFFLSGEPPINEPPLELE